jgi:hypothetical protein
LKSSTAVSAATAATTATTGPFAGFDPDYADLPPEYKRLLTGFTERMMQHKRSMNNVHLWPQSLVIGSFHLPEYQ